MISRLGLDSAECTEYDCDRSSDCEYVNVIVIVIVIVSVIVIVIV